MKKSILFLVLGYLFLQSCSSTPTIETRHKPIPHRKVEAKNKKPESTENISVFTKVLQETNTAEPRSPFETVKTVSQTTTISAPNETVALNAAIPMTSLSDAVASENPVYTGPALPTEQKKIGLILPLTGKNAAVGQRALNAIRLGLGLINSGSEFGFSIAIFDNQSNPDLAAIGVDKLMREDHVVALLGGLSSKEATSISAKAEFYQVPFISFSQKSGITQNTNYTFRNSVTAEMQVERLVKYAIQGLGAKRFAILYPNDSYGTEFANKYWDLVLAAGGQVTTAQVYDPKDSDFNIYIQKLVGTYYVEARIEEYRQRQKEIALKQKKKQGGSPVKKNSRENEAKENILTPIVDFDVLFIPDSSKALGQTIAFMKNNDVSNITFLGTNLWNSPDLVRRAGSGKESVFFVDAIPSPEEVGRSEFHAKYTAIYQEAPSLVEAQFYESAVLLKDLIGSSSVSRQGLASQLKVMGRRSGAYNEIRMNNDHEIERPLNIFGLANGEILKTE